MLRNEAPVRVDVAVGLAHLVAVAVVGLATVQGCGSRTGLDTGVTPITPGQASEAGPNTILDAQATGNEGAIMFGGANGTVVFGDTWIWSDSSWKQAEPAQSPSARVGAAAATWKSMVLLFGGANPGATMPPDTFNDTWLWDGTSWTPQHPPRSPSIRDSASTSPLGAGVVLFGGQWQGNRYGDTWVWDGSTWTQQSPATSPPARGAAAVTSWEGKVLLFGGDDGTGTQLSDTWVWDGVTWTEQHPARSPLGRTGAVLATLDGVAVLFGGMRTIRDPTNLGDTWTWDGANWSEQAPATSPSPRDGAVAATLNGEIVVFGGLTGLESGWQGDTWLWDGADWAQSAVTGPGARAGAVVATW
jgi:N-acetylneuraminic acid mutarotase